MVAVMKLTQWLSDNKVSQAEFGRQVGLTQGRISQIADRGTADARTAKAISAATDYAVSVDELLMARTEPGAERQAASA